MKAILVAVISGGVAAAIVSGVFGIIMYKMKRNDEKADKSDHIVAGVKMIMYDRIKFLGKKHVREGNISSDELEDLIAMHNVYHNDLGGNGFLDNVMEQVKHLPIVDS